MAEYEITEGTRRRKWVHSYSKLKDMYVVGLYDLVETMRHGQQWILRHQVDEGSEAYDVAITLIAENQKKVEKTADEEAYALFAKEEFDKKAAEFLKNKGV